MQKFEHVSKSDLIGSYVREVYGNKPVLVVFDPYSNIRLINEKIFNNRLTDFLSLDDYLFVSYDTIEEAISVCNSIPGDPYIHVWENGELIHTN